MTNFVVCVAQVIFNTIIMKSLFLINLANEKSFDLGLVDDLIERSAVEVPEELCENTSDMEKGDDFFCQNAGEYERDVEEIVDYVVLNMIKQIIADKHPQTDVDNITLQTTNSDLELDSFDSLELLAQVEILFDEDIFDIDMEKKSFAMSDIAMGVKKLLTTKK